MILNKRVLAIIPARGGSKRLPRKNILELAGKPLIQWTIEAARSCSYIDSVVVSSDSPEILEHASNNGCVPLPRPIPLSMDCSSSVDVALHILETYKGFGVIIWLQPTSPLRTDKHIDQALELLEKNNYESVVSVCETEHSPLWSNMLNKDNSMKNFLQGLSANVRSQDLPNYYRLNGAIYINTNDNLKKYKSFLNEKTYAYIMESLYSVDIDSKVDFLLAEVLLREPIFKKNI